MAAQHAIARQLHLLLQHQPSLAPSQLLHQGELRTCKHGQPSVRLFDGARGRWCISAPQACACALGGLAARLAAHPHGNLRLQVRTTRPHDFERSAAGTTAEKRHPLCPQTNAHPLLRRKKIGENTTSFLRANARSRRTCVPSRVMRWSPTGSCTRHLKRSRTLRGLEAEVVTASAPRDAPPAGPTDIGSGPRLAPRKLVVRPKTSSRAMADGVEAAVAAILAAAALVALATLTSGTAGLCSRSKWRPPVATNEAPRAPPHLARRAAEAAWPFAARGTLTRTETTARTAGDNRAGTAVRVLRSGTLSAMERPVGAVRTVSRRALPCGAALFLTAGLGCSSKSAVFVTEPANPGKRWATHDAADRSLCSDQRALSRPSAPAPPTLWPALPRPAEVRSARWGELAGGDDRGSHVKPLASTRGDMVGPLAGKRSDSSSARIRFVPWSHSLQA